LSEKSVDPIVTGPFTKYAGKKYRLGDTPNMLNPDNAASWRIIEAMITAYGPRDFWDLAVACRDHKHGTQAAKGPQSWIRYCIRSGWLKDVG